MTIIEKVVKNYLRWRHKGAKAESLQTLHFILSLLTWFRCHGNKISIDLQWKKMKKCIYFCVTANTLTKDL